MHTHTYTHTHSHTHTLIKREREISCRRGMQVEGASGRMMARSLKTTRKSVRSVRAAVVLGGAPAAPAGGFTSTEVLAY